MILILIIIATIFSVGAEYLPLSMEIEYGQAYVVSYSCISVALFVSIPVAKTWTKTIGFTFCSWAVINCMSQLFRDTYFWCNSSIFYVQSIIMIPFFIYLLFKSYDVSGDEYSKDCVYIVVKKPKTFIDFFHSCVFRPISSISVVSNGLWFGYTRGMKYRQDPYIINETDVLIKVNFTHDYVLSKLDSMIGDKWSFANNCCHAVLELYPDINVGILNSIPCLLYKQLMRYENDRQNNC